MKSKNVQSVMVMPLSKSIQFSILLFVSISNICAEDTTIYKDYTLDKDQPKSIIIADTSITLNLNGFNVSTENSTTWFGIYASQKKKIRILGYRPGMVSRVYGGSKAIYLDNCNNSKVSYVTASGKDFGIVLQGYCYSDTISNCTITGNNFDGLYGEQIGMYNYIKSCKAINCGREGFFINWGSYTTFKNCQAKNNTGDGFNILGCSYMTINNCLASNNTNHGFIFWDDLGMTMNSDTAYNNQLTGFYDCPGHRAYFIATPTNLRATGNVIENFHTCLTTWGVGKSEYCQ